MTEMVNRGSLTIFGDERPTSEGGLSLETGPTDSARAPRVPVTPPSSGQLRPQTDAAFTTSGGFSDPNADLDAYNLSQFFVVDSFNIHRLVIAGVTCASKFFSDVFYTNSRYAKVNPDALRAREFSLIDYRWVAYHW